MLLSGRQRVSARAWPARTPCDYNRSAVQRNMKTCDPLFSPAAPPSLPGMVAARPSTSSCAHFFLAQARLPSSCPPSISPSHIRGGPGCGDNGHESAPRARSSGASGSPWWPGTTALPPPRGEIYADSCGGWLHHRRAYTRQWFSEAAAVSLFF